MGDNNIPITPDAGQDPEYVGDAAYRAYLNAVAPPIPPGQIQEFCPAEIPVRASLLRGDSALMQNFSSREFILSPISVTSSPNQNVQLIRAVSLFLSLEPDWLRLPGNRLASDQMLFTQSNHFSIYVARRLEITVGPDGDSINQFEVEPAGVESASLVIYPHCMTIAGLLTLAATPVQAQTFFLHFMPLHWNSSRRMETALLRNFPFDNYSSHTRLLLHLLAEYSDSCLRKHGHDELEYYKVLTPAVIGKSKTTEGIGRVFLPPILSGLNMDLSAVFCNAVVFLPTNQLSSHTHCGKPGRSPSYRIHSAIWGPYSARNVY